MLRTKERPEARRPNHSTLTTETQQVSLTNYESPIVVDRSLPGIALKLPISISFSYLGCRISAVARDTSDGPVVSVTGVVGSVPFSVESPTARIMIRAILANLPSSGIVKLEAGERNQIVLRGEAPIGNPPSPAGVVAAASAVLSAAKPLIDLLAEIGARPTQRSSLDAGEQDGGTAKVAALS